MGATLSQGSAAASIPASNFTRKLLSQIMPNHRWQMFVYSKNKAATSKTLVVANTSTTFKQT